MLALIGGGKMGEALLRGWRAAPGPGLQVAVVEPSAPRRDELAHAFPDVSIVASLADLDGVSEAVLAVKPADVASVAQEAVAAGARRVLSIAAGVRLAALVASCGDAEVVRAMPNTPALVGAAMSAIALGPRCSAETEAWALTVLGAVGKVVVVDESLLDAVTAVSGSGPAYVFLVAEAMVEAAVLVGLSRDTAQTLVAHTIRGAGEMLVRDPAGAATLRGNVTSPAGTTAAGLAQLEAGGLRSAITAAVNAAAARSEQLGRSS